MDYVHFIAGQDDKGRRLDRILRRILPENSLSGLYKSLRNGLIKVDGKKQKPEFHVSEGSDISVAAFLITPESSGQNSKDAENSFIDEKLVVFRNKYLLILNKPYDVNVQKAVKNENSLDEMVKKDFEARGLNKESLSFKTGPLHRLDKKTTGLIAFSQNLEGARWFSKAIMSHETKKTYLALVQGKMTEYENWQDEIEKNDEKSSEKVSDSIKFHTVKVKNLSESHKNGKFSWTEAFPLSGGMLDGKEVTLVKFVIHTGRTHQIRAQSSFHGYPLYGDTAYGVSKSKYERELYLHAWKLDFKENPCQLPSQIVCPLNLDFKNILKVSMISFNSEL